MIKLRLSFSKDESGREFDIIDGELLSDAMKRALDGVPLGKFKAEETFKVVVNGVIIEGNFWTFVKLKSTDTVVVSPDFKSGDPTQVFKQALTIAIIAAIAVYVPPLAGGVGTFSGALAAGVATVAAVMALNALIPPPIPKLGDISGPGEMSSSQMYSISGQSNQMKRMEVVPKVYGTHRMFPVVAAAPYTELSVSTGAPSRGSAGDLRFAAKAIGTVGNDIQIVFQGGGTVGNEVVSVSDRTITITYVIDASTAQQILTKYNASAAPALASISIATGEASSEQSYQGTLNLGGGENPGETVQTLYCIYDFGLGTARVSDLRIGDTPLSAESFTDFNYNFVDPNVPAVPEDEFDEGLRRDFEFYRGRRETSPLSAGLSDGETLVNFSDPNNDADPAEILLDLVCPRGLYGYSSNGTIGERKIRLEIDFALAGTSVWYPYNDLNYVDSYSATGGNDFGNSFKFQGANSNSETADAYYIAYVSEIANGSEFYNGNPSSVLQKYIRPGGKKLLVPDNDSFTVGAKVFTGNRFLGLIETIEDYGPDASLTVLTLDRVMTTQVDILVHEIYGNISTYHPGNEGWGGYYDHVWDGFFRQKAEFRSDQHETGVCNIIGSNTSPVYSSIRFAPKVAGQYQVRVRRVSTTSDFITQTGDDLTWGGLTTAYSVIPLNTLKRHTFLELKIRATDQLNGNIQNLSGIVSTVIPAYNGSEWVRVQTSNPAWVFCDLLTGEINKRPMNRNRLHMESILQWADYCEQIPDAPEGTFYNEPRFTCNFVFDYEATLSGIVAQVTGMSQASMNIIDGKYGVLVDRFKETPVQLFTPRNSKDFSSTRVYGPQPHAMTVKYIDPNAAWEIQDVTVYDNEYDSSNATDIEEISAFACTSNQQAWRFGRYVIAQNKFRRETISLQVDFENIVCTRGDFVQITQDVMKVGGTAARVKAVDGSTITIDDSLDISPDIDYGYVFRSLTGTISVTNTLTPVSPNEFTLDGDIPAVGDLISIGEVDHVVFDCIVKTIAPNDDMSATLTLVEKADEIYEYESTNTLPDYDPQIAVTSKGDFYPPKAVTNLVIGDQAYECAPTKSGYNYYVELTWDVPPGSVYEMFQIWVNDGRGYKAVDTTSHKYYKFNVDQTRLDIEHKFKVVAVSASGKKLQIVEMTEVITTPEAKTDPPSDIASLDMSITNQVLQLSWSPIADCDVFQYVVRYSPEINDVWVSSIPLVTVSSKVTSISVQARTGVYLVKAIDFAGNQSETAAVAITTIPNLFDLNVVDELNDAPDFLGEFEQTELLGEAVILGERVPGDVDTVQYYEEGFYNFADLFDLGDVYSVRLQSAIRADGLKKGETMDEWEHLSDVDHLNTSLHSDWDIALQYRATDTFAAMSDWAHLSEIDHINYGAGVGYTDWRDIPTAGDATGRIFQFRTKLISYTPNVTPRLFDATVKADMPDRQDSFENETSHISEATVLTYETAFAGPGTTPNVQVSIDGGASGDYWSFDYKTLEGLAIRFYDDSDTQVVRQFDLVAKGYGHQHSLTI